MRTGRDQWRFFSWFSGSVIQIGHKYNSRSSQLDSWRHLSFLFPPITWNMFDITRIRKSEFRKTFYKRNFHRCYGELIVCLTATDLPQDIWNHSLRDAESVCAFKQCIRLSNALHLLLKPSPVQTELESLPCEIHAQHIRLALFCRCIIN